MITGFLIGESKMLREQALWTIGNAISLGEDTYESAELAQFVSDET